MATVSVKSTSTSRHARTIAVDSLPKASSRPLFLSSTDMRQLDGQIVQFYRDCGRSQFDVVIEMGSGSNRYIRDAIAHVVLHRSTRHRVGGHVEIMIQYPRWLNIVWNVRGVSQIGHVPIHVLY